MFLTAVLQAHTDGLPRAGASSSAVTSPRADVLVSADASSGVKTSHHAERAPAPALAAKEAAVAMPAQLEKALKLPLAERLQPLPSVHRSRWV